jgi:hypothetical protein
MVAWRRRAGRAISGRMPFRPVATGPAAHRPAAAPAVTWAAAKGSLASTDAVGHPGGSSASPHPLGCGSAACADHED